MKVLIIAQGSRGDVQPFAALARQLKGAGHEVVFAGPDTSIHLAAPHSTQLIPFVDLAKKLIAVAGPALEANRNSVRGQLLAARYRRTFRALMADALGELTKTITVDADVVVYHPLWPGHEIAERIGAVPVPVCLVPAFVPTKSFRSPLLPAALPSALNRASYAWTARWLRPIPAAAHRRWRRDMLRLPRRRGHRNPFLGPDGKPGTALQPVSKHVLPTPLHYPNWLHTTGYWFLPAESDWTAPTALTEFLSAGEPPVYLGFGSMSGTAPREHGRIIVEAVRSARVRAVVATGWGGIELEVSDPTVFCVPDAPHDWLFPRTSAIVHHGGAGTTGAALAAGRPQLVCPFMPDQRFWGDRVHAIGVGCEPLAQHRFTPGNLAAALRRLVSDRTLVDKALAVGEAVRAEDGLADAVRVLEELTVHSGVSRG